METAVIIFGILTGIFLIVILFDIIPLASTFIGRIHIGRWSDTKKWKAITDKQGLKQLKKTPGVPITDNTRFTLIDRLRGQYKNKNIAAWQKAALILGAQNIKNESSDKMILDCIKKLTDKQGDWAQFNKSVDSAMLAFSILNTEAVDTEKIRTAMQKTAEILLDAGEKHETIPYNPSIANIRFVDTVGMICPFLFKYDKEYECQVAFDLGKRQLEEYLKHGIDEKTGLPYHCFDKENKANLGVAGWGRGSGWFCVALADSYNSTGNKQMREFLEIQMKIFADTLIEYQLSNGGWSRQILAEKTGEASSTAMISWFMGEVYNLTGNEKYLNCLKNGASFLKSCTRQDGTIDYAQGDTKAIGFYSAKLSPMPAAQGFVMRIEV